MGSEVVSDVTMRSINNCPLVYCGVVRTRNYEHL